MIKCKLSAVVEKWWTQRCKKIISKITGGWHWQNIEDAESENIQNSAPDKFKQVTEWMNGRQRWRAWTEITEYSRSFRDTNTQTMSHEINSKMEYNTSIFSSTMIGKQSNGKNHGLPKRSIKIHKNGHFTSDKDILLARKI